MERPVSWHGEELHRGVASNARTEFGQFYRPKGANRIAQAFRPGTTYKGNRPERAADCRALFPKKRSSKAMEMRLCPRTSDVACACPADAATQYRNIRAWVDEGSAKVPLACKPSELEAWLARAGREPTSFRRCSRGSSTGRTYTRDAYAPARRDAHAEVVKLTVGSKPAPFHTF